MSKKLQDFLQSDLLERYLSGATSVIEDAKVERYIQDFNEVREEYEVLQDQLELTARAQSVVPKKDILAAVMNEIEDRKVVTMKPASRGFNWYGIAASVAAIGFAFATYFYYNQNQTLEKENNLIVEEIFDLRADIDNNNAILSDVMKKMNKLDNPETQKYFLRGNNRAEDLKAVAYINPVEKSSLIDVVSLPELNDEQVYQIWAQVQDKMINLGILDKADRNLRSVPYIEDALSLSITIEPKGGNDNASLENEVAEIPLQATENNNQ